MSEAAHVRTMARYNAWANARLHGACARLAAQEFAAERVSFFPSLRETLNHILIVDWYYLDLFEGGGRGRATQEVAIPYPDALELASARARADRRLVAFCDGLDEPGLARTISKDTDRIFHDERVGDLLTHLFVHQIHHRGQAHAMLAGTDVAPPQLDEFFLAADSRTRTEELDRLGISAG